MGNRISEIRRAAKVSQLVLADELGWSQGRWSNYESGRRVPGLAESRAIVGCFLGIVVPAHWMTFSRQRQTSLRRLE